ncbi:hypothetical protein KKH3_00030 [Pectobacterium actinidiae]|nr:hypothetical protein KKH3_00030 [Pectobacterium actinidiae]
MNEDPTGAIARTVIPGCTDPVCLKDRPIKQWWYRNPQ